MKPPVKRTTTNDKPKESNARQKAIDFAKNIPKPKIAPVTINQSEDLH